MAWHRTPKLSKLRPTKGPSLQCVIAQRGRSVPPVGTLENPPGSETKEEGPAWELPELKRSCQRSQPYSILVHSRTRRSPGGTSLDVLRAVCRNWALCPEDAPVRHG